MTTIPLESHILGKLTRRLLVSSIWLLAVRPALPAASFIRGDVDANGTFQITDPIRTLGFLFLGQPRTLDCLDAADSTDDGVVNITDVVYSLGFLYLGGPAPPPPSDFCGDDPTNDSLECASFSRCAAATPTRLVSSSPLNGEQGISVSRETILRFSGPLDVSTVKRESIHAEFGGQRLTAQLHLSPDASVVTLFHAGRLPASARVRVTIDGSLLRDASGQPVDADSDGIAGGIRTIDFDTLTLTTLSGTRVCGRVFASALAPGAGGASINQPLEGAVITVDGRGDLHASTDSMGNFCLDPAPAGSFFVFIDGNSAIGEKPPGAYYPFVGKKWESVPGAETNIGDIYLPLIPEGTLQDVSRVRETAITFAPSVLAAHPELAGVHITVPPDSPYLGDGSRGGKVGIAPVPPDRLPQALPPGMEPPIVITIQTDGASNFDVPVQACFPNLPDGTGAPLAPGAKSWLYSFNHDSGRYEPVGSMTVSLDGMLICTDPGVGIVAPGWHFPGPPPQNPPPPCDDCYCDLGGGGGDGGGGEADPYAPCFKKKSKSECRQCCKDTQNDLIAKAVICETGPEGFASAFEGATRCRKKCKDCFPSGGGGGGTIEEILAGFEDADPTLIEVTRIHLQVEELLYPSRITGSAVPADVQSSVDALRSQADAIVQGNVGQYLLSMAASLEAEEPADDEGNAPSYPVQYAATIERGGGIMVLRGETGPFGQYDLFVPRDGKIQYVELYDAFARSYAIAFPRILPGAPHRLRRFTLTPVNSYFRDFDADGLPDVAEHVYGSDPVNPDTDGDGILDGAEIEEGLDLLGGRPSRTGIIATAQVPGTAIDIGTFNNLAVVAAGQSGVSVFNVFNGLPPILVAQVDTPGEARAVSLSGSLAAVADGHAGLCVVDLADPPAARVLHSLPLVGRVIAVTTGGPFAYAGLVSGRLVMVDLRSGEVLQNILLESPIMDLAIEGERLFVLTLSRIHAYSIWSGTLEHEGQVELSLTTRPGPPELITGRNRLFVGGGIAYATRLDGFSEFDVSDPAAMRSAGPPTSESLISFKQIVANGSGLGVAAVGSNPRDDGTHDLWLYDVSNPQSAGQFLTVFPTPGVAHAVSIFNGLAHAADGASGIHVINYRDYDRAGLPPTISLSTNFLPGAAEESKVLRLTASATDDVQVRNVEFYVDGALAATDGNFPFEHRFLVPTRAAQSSLRIQARATDTGGNDAWTTEETLTILADATPPQLLRSEPAGGTVVRPDVTAEVSAVFREPLNPATVTSQSFQLYEAGEDGMTGTADDVSIAGALSYRDETATVTLALSSTLPVGKYRVVLKAPLGDVAGNAVPAVIDWTFEARAAMFWNRDASGFWDDPANWSTGKVPSTGDIVVIDRPAGSFTVTYRGGSTSLTSLLSEEAFVLASGSLAITQEATFNGSLSIAADLLGPGDVTVTGPCVWTAGTLGESGQMICAGGLEVNAGFGKTLTRRTLENRGAGVLRQAFAIQRGGVFKNAEGASFSIEGDIQLSDSGSGPAFFDNLGALIKTSGAGTAHMSIPLQNSGSLDVRTGTLNLAGGGSSTGPFHVSKGAVLSLGGQYDCFEGTTVDGGGGLVVSAGTQTVGLYTDLSVTSLAFGGGTLTGIGNLTVTESFVWSGGTLTGAGLTVVEPGATLDVAPGFARTLQGRTIENRGHVSFRQGLFIIQGGVLRNAEGATLSIDADVQITPAGSGPGSIDNLGMLVKSAGAGEAQVTTSLKSTGSVDVQAGKLVLAGGGSSTGSLQIAGGGALLLGSAFELNAGSSVSGDGTLIVASGVQTVSINTDLSVKRLDFRGAVIDGSSKLSITESFIWSGGTLSGSGLTVIEPGATLDLAPGFGRTLDGKTLVNHGSATVRQGFFIVRGGALRNMADASLSIDGDVQITSAGSGPGSIENLGAFVKSAGAGQAQLSISFQNAGSVGVESGTLALTGGGSSTGPFQVDAGCTLLLGSVFDLNAGSSVDGDGTLLVASGIETVTLNTDLSVKKLDFRGPTIAGSGDLTVTESFVWTGGTLTGAGLTVIEPGAALDIAPGFGRALDGRTLENRGAASVRQGFFVVRGGLLRNAAGATLSFDGDVAITDAGNGPASIENAGTLMKSGGAGTADINLAVGNTGIVEARSGTLSFNKSFVQTAGAMRLLGGNFGGTALIDIQGGMLEGAGTVTASVRNAATVHAGASPGILAITGAYTQTASGVLKVGLGGLAAGAAHDQLAVTGAVTLGGTLDVSLLNGFSPAAGDNFKVATFNSRAGSFSTTNGNGRTYTTSQGAAAVSVIAQ